MFATLENLKLRALALRSSVHNEQQLTAVELAAMNAKKTNEIIEIINELVAGINKLSTDGVQYEWDETTETLKLKIFDIEV